MYFLLDFCIALSIYFRLMSFIICLGIFLIFSSVLQYQLSNYYSNTVSVLWLWFVSLVWFQQCFHRAICLRSPKCNYKHRQCKQYLHIRVIMNKHELNPPVVFSISQTLPFIILNPYGMYPLLSFIQLHPPISLTLLYSLLDWISRAANDDHFRNLHVLSCQKMSPCEIDKLNIYHVVI